MENLKFEKNKKAEKRNWIVVASVVLNIILLVTLTGVTIRENYPTRLLKKIHSLTKEQEQLPSPPFLSERYRVLTEIFSMYGGQKNIVMLGNSLTAGVDWVELLNRCDIANRGIGGDITEGYIHRIDCVLDLQPEVCFIEGGINDLHMGISEETIVGNLQMIIDTLQRNNIKPVLTTVSFVTQKRNNERSINDKVKALNELIFQLAARKNVPVLDLNGKLSDGNFLKNEYAIGDGLHFNAKAYTVWKNEVLEILKNEITFLTTKEEKNACR